MSASVLAHLTHALSIVLPTPVETSLLRACLGSEALARQAWALYRERAGDLPRLLANDRRGLKKLMPLLLRAVEQNGLEADDSLLTLLRTAYLRARLRSKTVRLIVHEVLHALATDRLPHVVLGGVALAETAYPDPALRHCATIDLLLRADDLPRGARRLSALASTPPGIDDATSADPLVLRHGSGLPIELRSRLVPKRDHPVSLDALFAASRAETVAGVPTRVLSPPDHLLDACLGAFFGSGRTGLGWVPDAWHVLHGFADPDWDVLLERSREGQLALPLLVTLGYLAQQLDAPIPAAVLGQLGDAAARADPVRGERALAAAVASTPGSVLRLLRTGGGWGPRLTVVKWMLVPSRGYLRANYDVSRAWLVPFYYLYRPLRFVARRLAGLGR